MSTILIVYSDYYKELAEIQLSQCIELLKPSKHAHAVEHVEAGCYEIPAVIRYYHQVQPFDAYIALGLLLQGSTDHYDFIWQHIKDCFTQLTLQGLFIGNGIISASHRDLMTERVMQGERVHEAFRAVDYFVQLQKKLKP
jgi:6,7-dimethyl-8-ribityllumazine synthase